MGFFAKIIKTKMKRFFAKEPYFIGENDEKADENMAKKQFYKTVFIVII